MSGTRLPQAGTSAVHSGLTPGTAYYYVVTGINDTGEGPPSGEALATARNDIQLSIVRPVAAFVPGSVDVAVRITSVFQLANVVVVAAGQSPSLVYNASSVLWEGTISLTTAGVPAQIVVTATDVQGTTAVASAAVIPQSLVALAVSSPAEGSVIQGTVRLTATCQNCASISVSPDRIVGFPSVTLATGPSPLDQTVSLGQYNGFAVSLRFVATGNGQQVSIVRNVYVETSPQLEIVSTMGGRALILDVTADRILVSDSLTGTFAVRVRDRSTGADAVLFTGAPSNQRPRVGALTPGGALFVVGGTLYEARGGSVAQVGSISDPLSLRVAGSHAIWSNLRVLTRRDLAAGTTTVIATDASNSTNDVVSNGDIVYSTCCDLPSPLAYDIVRYRNGVASRLTNDDEAVLRNVDPVTDGTNVIYAKYDASVNQLATEAVTLSGTETLAARTPGQTPSHLRYAVSNGWIAFDRPVLGGIAQVFRRSPTGVESQVSFFGQGAEVTALAPDGSVVFLNVADQHYYIRRPGGSPLELGSRLGRLRFVGTDAYVIIAGTLLRLR